jgi:predicted O-methyltransferase YrrM
MPLRYLMGEAHRKAILSRLPENGYLLEWGSGTTTIWFLENMTENQTLVSVEHHPQWHAHVSRLLTERKPKGKHLYILAEGKAGANATPEEECPSHLHSYVMAPLDLSLSFDVILVDGVARNSCLFLAYHLLTPRGIVFLHDAQRPWYRAAKSVYHEEGELPSCPDYPKPTLWIGSKK